MITDQEIDRLFGAYLQRERKKWEKKGTQVAPLSNVEVVAALSESARETDDAGFRSGLFEEADSMAAGIDRNNDRDRALNLVNSARKSVVDRAIDRLKEDASVAGTDSEVLTMLKNAATPNDVINRIVELLKDACAVTPQAAANALADVASAAPELGEMVTAFGNLFNDDNASVRSAAATALGKVGRAVATQPVLDGLVDMLNDEEWRVQQSAADALGRLGPSAAREDVLDRLAALLDDSDEDVKMSAAATLAKMGEAAASERILAFLTPLVESDDLTKRGAATTALRSMRPHWPLAFAEQSFRAEVTTGMACADPAPEGQESPAPVNLQTPNGWSICLHEKNGASWFDVSHEDAKAGQLVAVSLQEKSSDDSGSRAVELVGFGLMVQPAYEVLAYISTAGCNLANRRPAITLIPHVEALNSVDAEVLWESFEALMRYEKREQDENEAFERFSNYCRAWRKWAKGVLEEMNLQSTTGETLAEPDRDVAKVADVLQRISLTST